MRRHSSVKPGPSVHSAWLALAGDPRESEQGKGVLQGWPSCKAGGTGDGGCEQSPAGYR